MSAVLLLIDRAKEWWLRWYRRRTFLARIGQETRGSNCRVLGKVYVNATSVRIGRNVTIYPGVYFWGDGDILIGDNCSIGKDTLMFASKNGGIHIGDNVLIAAHCSFWDSDHGVRRGDLIAAQPLESALLVIEDDVWVSANCTVIKGACIREGAVIGAGAVVNSEVPEYSIAVGVPARVVGERHE